MHNSKSMLDKSPTRQESVHGESSVQGSIHGSTHGASCSHTSSSAPGAVHSTSSAPDFKNTYDYYPWYKMHERSPRHAAITEYKNSYTDYYPWGKPGGGAPKTNDSGQAQNKIVGTLWWNINGKTDTDRMRTQVPKALHKSMHTVKGIIPTTDIEKEAEERMESRLSLNSPRRAAAAANNGANGTRLHNTSIERRRNDKLRVSNVLYNDNDHPNGVQPIGFWFANIGYDGNDRFEKKNF